MTQTRAFKQDVSWCKCL